MKNAVYLQNNVSGHLASGQRCVLGLVRIADFYVS